MYALNLDPETKRILSVWKALEGVEHSEMPMVDELPTGETDAEKDTHNWLYIDGQYLYDPLPVPEPPAPTPTPESRITALEQTLDALIGGIMDAV